MAASSNITMQNKLQNFSRHVFAQAYSQRDEIEEWLAAKEKEVLSRAEIEALEAAYNKIQQNKVRIQRASNEDINRRQLEGKKQLTAHRSEIMAQVFDDVRKKIDAFIASDDYYPWLLDSARAAVQSLGEGDIAVFINESDAKFSQKLEADCQRKVLLLEPSVNIIGGVRAVNKTKHTVYTDNFAQKLEEQKKEFLRISGLLI